MHNDLKEIATLAKIPMTEESDTGRVEIIMLKFKESPEVINKAITRIVHNTDWPFKLTVYDNRPNSANTSRIWNKLIRESTCPFVLIIDSDAYIPEEKLSPCWLTRMMESLSETGVVIPVSSAQGGFDQRRHAAKEYPTTKRNDGIWSGFCFLVDKRVFDKLGYFDERFYIYGQDSEWAHRVKSLGGAVMREDVLVEHVGGASFKSNPIRDKDKMYARTLFKTLTTN